MSARPSMNVAEMADADATPVKAGERDALRLSPFKQHSGFYSLRASLESQPVIHLQENDIRRRALKQRPGVVSEVDLAALQLRRPTASPDEKQRRAGVVVPAEHDVAAQSAERAAATGQRDVRRGPGRPV